MAYTRHDWSNGDTFSATEADAWEGRIESEFIAVNNAIDAVGGTDLTAVTDRLDALENKIVKVPPSPNTPAANTYSIAASDIGCEVQTLVNGTDKVWTLTDIAATVGDCIFIGNNGTSGATLTIQASGVTLRIRGGSGNNLLSEQWAVARLRKEAAGIWRLSGELG